MKKLSLGLCLLSYLFIVGCKNDDDNKGTVNTLFEVEFGGNYATYFLPIYVVLSNADGSIIDSRPVSNGSRTVFKNTEGITAPITVTIFGDVARSYLEVPVGSNWFLDNPKYVFEEENGKAKVVINNTGELDYPPYTFSCSNGNGAEVDMVNNDMFLTLSIDEANSFFATYRSELEAEARYLFINDIKPGDSLSYEHTALPFLGNPINISLPAYISSGHTTIKGDPVGNEDRLMYLGSYGMDTFSSFYIPELLFERFYTFTEGYLSDQEFYTFQYYSQQLPNSIAPPKFEYTADAIENGVNLTSNPGFDVIEICLNDPNISNYAWYIVSERKPNLAFNLPEIPKSIFDVDAWKINGLKVTSSNAIKYDTYTSYEEYLTQINSKEGIMFNRFESILRTP